MADTAYAKSTEGLHVEDIWKGYGTVQILKGVSIDIKPGRVLALIGHNGAGKSTLLRSICGAEVPERGTITVDGDSTPFTGPKDAAERGIGIVYQELSLINQLTVAENLYLGVEKTNGVVLDRRAMNAHADELCKQFNIPARGTTLVGDLPVAQRQLFEVARAIDQKAKYLLLDEPTTALEEAQVAELLAVIRTLKEQGIGILLIDHKLEEVYAVADDVVGLSSGQIVLNAELSQISRREVVEAIVGDHHVDHPTASEAAQEQVEAEHRAGEIVFTATGLRGEGLESVELSVRAGEIVGIYGLVGSGRSEFLRTIYGANALRGGSMELGGRAYRPRNPGQAIAEGVAFVSEERKFDGFIPQMDAVDNVAFPVLGRKTRSGILDWGALRSEAKAQLAKVAIRGDVNNPITSLSGGNQQKAILARATLQGPRLLLLDEPTKGVDIGAKDVIYGVIRKLAREGVAVIVVSSEDEELLEIADQITVFRAGTCDGHLMPKAEVTGKQLRELAWGDDG